MPKRRHEYDLEGDDSTYEEAYGNGYYGKTRRKGRDKNEDVYGDTVKANESSAKGSSCLKYFVIGFSLVTISGFAAAFVLILQLRQEVADLQSMRAAQATTVSPLTQPAPFTETLGAAQTLPNVGDENTAAALNQLNDADRQIRDAFDKMSGDFRALQKWTEQSISQASDKITNDLCSLENLLEQWAIPVDTLGALLSVEGWTKAHEGLYTKVFTHHYQSYADAKAECQKLGARLASKSLKHLGDQSVALSYVWIGYDDIQTEGVWVWSDGTKAFHPDRLQWISNQPDNEGGNEDCAYILRPENGKYLLNDYTCHTEQHYICEKDTTHSSTNENC